MARERGRRVARDGDREEVFAAQIEAVLVSMANGVSLWSVHDEPGHALRVERWAGGTHGALAEGPVRGHATGHEGVVIVGVEDGMGVDRSERDAHDGAPPVIDPALWRTKGEGAHWGSLDWDAFTHERMGKDEAEMSVQSLPRPRRKTTKIRGRCGRHSEQGVWVPLRRKTTG